MSGDQTAVHDHARAAAAEAAYPDTGRQIATWTAVVRLVEAARVDQSYAVPPTMARVLAEANRPAHQGVPA